MSGRKMSRSDPIRHPVPIAKMVHLRQSKSPSMPTTYTKLPAVFAIIQREFQRMRAIKHTSPLNMWVI